MNKKASLPAVVATTIAVSISGVKAFSIFRPGCTNPRFERPDQVFIDRTRGECLAVIMQRAHRLP